MFAQAERETFDLFAEMFFRQDVDRVLDRVGRDDFGVVARARCRRKSKSPLQHRRDVDLLDRVDLAVCAISSERARAPLP